MKLLLPNVIGLIGLMAEFMRRKKILCMPWIDYKETFGSFCTHG
jgi:hypothetical protein